MRLNPFLIRALVLSGKFTLVKDGEGLNPFLIRALVLRTGVVLGEDTDTS